MSVLLVTGAAWSRIDAGRTLERLRIPDLMSSCRVYGEDDGVSTRFLGAVDHPFCHCPIIGWIQLLPDGRGTLNQHSLE